MNTSTESTYQLLVRSEEKGRTVLETILYTLCILSVISAICQFALQRVEMPAPGITPCVACVPTAAAPLHG